MQYMQTIVKQRVELRHHAAGSDVRSVSATLAADKHQLLHGHDRRIAIIINPTWHTHAHTQHTCPH